MTVLKFAVTLHTKREGRDGLGGGLAVAGDGEPAKQSMRWRWRRMWLGYSDGIREWEGRLQHKEGYFERRTAN